LNQQSRGCWESIRSILRLDASTPASSNNQADFFPYLCRLWLIALIPVSSHSSFFICRFCLIAVEKFALVSETVAFLDRLVVR
jgi:hypothetical protein